MQETEIRDTDWASRDWTYGKILRDKTIVVTGCSSGIGRDTAKLIKQLGGDVIGVDRNKTEDYVDELYLADLSDRRTIKALVNALPGRIDGIANIAGLPPTAPADLVVKVNLVGLKYFTELMVPKLNDNASIVNLASLAGFGWPDALEAIKRDGIERLVVVPLYPQFSVSTSGSSLRVLEKEFYADQELRQMRNTVLPAC